jgi:hypothetical protein
MSDLAHQVNNPEPLRASDAPVYLLLNTMVETDHTSFAALAAKTIQAFNRVANIVPRLDDCVYLYDDGVEPRRHLTCNRIEKLEQQKKFDLDANLMPAFHMIPENKKMHVIVISDRWVDDLIPAERAANRLLFDTPALTLDFIIYERDVFDPEGSEALDYDIVKIVRHLQSMYPERVSKSIIPRVDDKTLATELTKAYADILKQRTNRLDVTFSPPPLRGMPLVSVPKR